MPASRLAIGTVQFGLPYGIANQQGQTSAEDAATILQKAWSAGIDTLDTAISYGESETRLGEIGISQWRVITKLPAVPDGCKDLAGWINDAVLSSLARLRIQKLGGLLMHRSEQLIDTQMGDKVFGALNALKEQGLIEKVGVSIYATEELDMLFGRYPIDLIQAPFNIIDRRLVSSGWLNKLNVGGVEVHVRSIFLQGLLLMNQQTRPPLFKRWQTMWNTWDRWLAEQSLTPVQAGLGFALSQPEIKRVVVGVDQPKQLDEIIAGANGIAVIPPPELSCADIDLVNPSRWLVT